MQVFVLKEITFNLFRAVRLPIAFAVDQEVPEQVENLVGKGDNCFEVADSPL